MFWLWLIENCLFDKVLYDLYILFCCGFYIYKMCLLFGYIYFMYNYLRILIKKKNLDDDSIDILIC